MTSFMINTGRVETFFGNLAYAYRDYGVVYCLSTPGSIRVSASLTATAKK